MSEDTGASRPSTDKVDRGYGWPAKIERVVDGDTVVVMLDRGMKDYSRRTLRLYGIDAPESRTRDLEEKARGKASTAFLEEIVERCQGDVWIESHEWQGKFGRLIATIWVGDMNVNRWLVEMGHAVYRDYS